MVVVAALDDDVEAVVVKVVVLLLDLAVDELLLVAPVEDVDPVTPCVEVVAPVVAVEFSVRTACWT